MIEIRDLWKRYGDNTVLSGIDLDAPSNGVTALIGPSGSGKTTLLRLIDLLDEPTSGVILFDGVDAGASEKAKLEMRRRMVIVFQKPVVFNSTVYDNVAYGLKIRGSGKSVVQGRVRHALETVDLAGYESRRARTLSGGEIQRVALARAMVTEPELLLLDEPTANLDPVSIARVESLIARVIGELRATVIMTTHDMAQGQRLANRIGVLIGGEMLQVGAPSEIFNLPHNTQVAQFVGVENILEGEIASREAGLVNVSIGGAMIEGVFRPGVGFPRLSLHQAGGRYHSLDSVANQREELILRDDNQHGVLRASCTGRDRLRLPTGGPDHKQVCGGPGAPGGLDGQRLLQGYRSAHSGAVRGQCSHALGVAALYRQENRTRVSLSF